MKKNYKPNKETKRALSRIETKTESLQTDLSLLLDLLDLQTESSEYSSDVHQLIDSVHHAVKSAFLTMNIVNHGIHDKLWTNDNYYEEEKDEET